MCVTEEIQQRYYVILYTPTNSRWRPPLMRKERWPQSPLKQQNTVSGLTLRWSTSGLFRSGSHRALVKAWQRGPRDTSAATRRASSNFGSKARRGAAYTSEHLKNLIFFDFFSVILTGLPDPPAAESVWGRKGESFSNKEKFTINRCQR